MKIITEQHIIKTTGNCDIVDITENVRYNLLTHKLKHGNANVFVVGSTASISTIEYEPGLKKDLPEILEKFIPSNKRYHHDDTWGDHNGHSHLRSTLFGCSQTVPFVNGELLLGTWQQIILIDFDERPRTRKVIVQLIGE
ncbi:MAG: secondary thiamine-phosphate synthase enzyme YjbQ [Chlorobi bacterium]|nr:secondary thiamine-phosphate synthase enzyme YjbQ [Chlorobiota bacterium]MCI0716779.1 secondary thiamine-phosphate synthase enzyme YjbQ [Chlorobiota bacterium]